MRERERERERNGEGATGTGTAAGTFAGLFQACEDGGALMCTWWPETSNYGPFAILHDRTEDGEAAGTIADVVLF